MFSILLIIFFTSVLPWCVEFKINKNDYLSLSLLARCSFDEQGAKNAIIDVLEEFVFGDNPETVLAKIRSEENASTVCGRVFKMNEPFYSCRECGMDPTCVLCVNCFKQSAHRHHKYKMGTSAGGGCCDCGDNEAWKQDHYCDEHKVSEQLQKIRVQTKNKPICLISTKNKKIQLALIFRFLFSSFFLFKNISREVKRCYRVMS